MNAARRRAMPATMILIALILAGFVFEFVTDSWNDGELLARQGAIVPEFVNRDHQYWRLLTAMFLHGDGTPGGTILHLGLNLLALYQIGGLYEVMFGTRRFVFIYFVAGIAASITSLLHIEGASVGASGAIFGIIGAFMLSVWRSPRFRHDRMARSIVNQLIFWTLANIAVATQMPQIDLAAHMGGLVAGAILGALLPHRVPPPPPAEVVVDVRPN